MSVIGTILKDDRAGLIGGGNPQSPAYWIEKLFLGGSDTVAGIHINEENALTISAWWNGINIISGAVGWLPFVVYKRRRDQGRDRAPNQPVFNLLHDRPNPYMDALVFRETLQSHALGWGNGYAEIERNGAGGPKALWPLPPNKVTPKVTEDRSAVYYEYITPEGQTKPILAEDMFHVHGLGFDGLKGYSVVHMARESLGTAKAIERYGSKFFANNATPPAVLEHPNKLDDDTLTNLRESWEKQHKGPENAGRIAILEEGMKLHQIGIPPEDAQYLVSRKFSVVEVARWLDIPPHMLKDLDKATFSNIEHQGIEFVTWSLIKWLKRWEGEANYKLFGKEARRLFFTEFIVAALLRGDTKTRFEAYRMAIYSGWMTRNQVRILENMNPDESELDKYLKPLNYETVGGGTTPEPPPVVIDGQRTDIPGDLPDQEGDNADLAGDHRVQPGQEPGPEVPPDTKPKQDSAFRALFESTWRRIVTKEVNALRKIVKNRGPDAVEPVKAFYEKHSAHVFEVLEPVLKVFGADARAVADEVKKYIEDSRADLVAALQYWDPEDILKDWQENKAVRMAAEFTERGRV